jgi:hypothetical protein
VSPLVVRRAVLAELAFSLAARRAKSGGLDSTQQAIAAVERLEGGRLGVAILGISRASMEARNAIHREVGTPTADALGG